jgi:ribosome-binding ATPase YchF (GTP1/OBG family)
VLCRHVESAGYSILNKESDAGGVDHLISLVRGVGEAGFDSIPEAVNSHLRIWVEPVGGLVSTRQHLAGSFGDLEHGIIVTHVKTVGITGPPVSGKTTLWRAITGGEAKGDIGTVAVPDPRLDTLVRLHSSPKRVPVQIGVIDVHASARSEAAALGRLRDVDAVVAVIPTFAGQDPQAELRDILDKLVIADLGPIENRLARAKKDLKAKNEVPALEAAMKQLESGSLLGDASWEDPELHVFSPLSPITMKPLLVVWNVGEDGLAQSPPPTDLPSFVVCAPIESEVADLDPEEARELLEAYGVKEPVRDRLISSVYETLDLITFFTLNEKECRAWNLRRGAKAPEAAGTVHSDMERGFIRAEVAGFDQVAQAGSWDAAKAKGIVRVEGKDYVVRDGDVIRIRFSP